MTRCVACNEWNGAPSPCVPEMCSACWWRLPARLRAAYQHGRLSVKRVVAKRRQV